jgi:polyhydroxybutyrate depolymerase
VDGERFPPGATGTVAAIRSALGLCALLTAVALSACSAGSGSSSGSLTTSGSPTSGAETRPRFHAVVAIPAGSSAQSLVVDGTKRTFRVYRPRTVATPAALVVMLHGALGTGAQAEQSYGWDAEADRGRFIVAYPDGLKRTWDVSRGCCGPAASEHVDDVAFIAALVRTISAALPVDRDRIYATGISNGGALSYRLACQTDVFAAIGPDSTNLLGRCASPAPISVIHIHGTADRTFPYDGGPGRHDNGGTGSMPVDTSGPPIPDLNARWRRIDRCRAPTRTRQGRVTTSVARCPDGRSVELITIKGAGHQWPGEAGPTGLIASKLDPPFPGLDATARIWNFFRTHPKPGAH